MIKELIGHLHQLIVHIDIRDKWWSSLGPVPFNIFSNGIDRRIECALSKFADGTKLSGMIDTSEGWDMVQRDQNKYEMQPMGIS